MSQPLKHKVTGRSKMYFFFKWYVAFMVKLYYRQVKIIGRNKVPDDRSVIFAPNHQNAFMDAIIFLPYFSPSRQLSYLVRASIFGSKWGDAFLYRCNILPVYRQIDGMENLGKNDVIFENCIYLMENKKILTLYPEGTHNVKKQKLSLKKGVSRIAFSAEERNNFNLDILIYPIGIYYTRLADYGGKVLVQFGDPIPIKEYIEDYKINPNKVLNQVKNRLDQALVDLMIDIKNNEFYYCIEFCCEMEANDKGLTLIEEDFKNSKEVVRKIEKLAIENPDKATELKSAYERYKATLDKHQFRDKLFSKKFRVPTIIEKLFFLLITPIGLYGWINNYLPFHIPAWIAKKKIKDYGFKSSIKSAASMILFPLFYLLQTAITILFMPNWWFVLGYYISLPITFYIGLWWRRKIMRFTSYGKYYSIKETEEIQEAIRLRNEITTILDSL